MEEPVDARAAALDAIGVAMEGAPVGNSQQLTLNPLYPEKAPKKMNLLGAAQTVLCVLSNLVGQRGHP
jgi:hypothetical protein